MTTRTTRQNASFKKPFRLRGYDEVFPAGTYVVETEEELIQGVSFPAYHRVLTIIHVRTRSGLDQSFQIHPADLEAALKSDAE
jgi:hypothetical protein